MTAFSSSEVRLDTSKTFSFIAPLPSVMPAVQAALFVYFEGFFELPVDSSDLARGTNGILSQCGDISDIHSYKYGSKEYGVPEKGITLELADGETPVYANLLNCGNCIVDAVIYDVWDMENGGHYVETVKESRVFNYSAVTIAYIIDTDVFEEEYGFPFPSIDGVTGGGTITLFLEFTCLDSVNVSELDIGYSIYDIFGSGDTHIRSEALEPEPRISGNTYIFSARTAVSMHSVRRINIYLTAHKIGLYPDVRNIFVTVEVVPPVSRVTFTAVLSAV